MKAIVYTKYGSPDVLKLEEAEKPVPANDEVLIKVHAASVNAYEWRHLRGDPFLLRMMGAGLLKPKHKILGADIAGKVVEVGGGTTQFQPGDEVFGEGSFGGYAEYVCVAENRLALKPVNLTMEEAAAVPMAALTALHGLRDKGMIRKGNKVLITGASGGVGTFAVQIARTIGAEVTGLCSTTKMDTVRTAGADYVIDYTREDVTKNGKQYDMIFDIASSSSIFDFKRILTPHGIYVIAGGSLTRIIQVMLISLAGAKNMSIIISNVNQKDLIFIKELIEAGKIKPIIDRIYPLNEVAEALGYLENRHARGKVVITVGHNGIN